MSEEKPTKRTGPGYWVSGPRDISSEIPLGMPTPKGTPIPDPSADAKRAVQKAREQIGQTARIA